MNTDQNNVKQLKIAFFSSSEFTIPILEEVLNNNRYSLAGVVTQPDWENRGKVYKNPISTFCSKHSIKLFQPTKLKNEYNEFVDFFDNLDIAVVASYGQIIPIDFLIFPKYGMINWHPSLLPAYRGPTPLQTSISNGDTIGGLTWIQMDKGMDSGAILLQTQIPYGQKTFLELINEMGHLGRTTLQTAIDNSINQKSTKQIESKATFTKMLSKEDGLLQNPNNTNVEIVYNMFRAYNAFPKIKIRSDKYNLIKILDCSVEQIKNLAIDDEDEQFYYSKGKIYLKCLDGILKINQFQLENGRIMKSK
ncbi:MAG: methionyl-tRNA formyltransferase [Patescibacteria group bacterium]